MDLIDGPQIGGYGTKYRVAFMVDARKDGQEERGACLAVEAYTDGEFPLSEANPGDPIRFHLCSAAQVVDFGLRLLEMASKEGARVTEPWGASVVARVRNLVDGCVT